VRPRPQLAAEAGTEEARYDLHVLRRDAEHGSHDVAMVYDSLGGFVEGELAVLVDGDGGVQFDGVMRFRGRTVDRVVLDDSGS
jgi:hypothetical protein